MLKKHQKHVAPQYFESTVHDEFNSSQFPSRSPIDIMIYSGKCAIVSQIVGHKYVTNFHSFYRKMFTKHSDKHLANVLNMFVICNILGKHFCVILNRNSTTCYFPPENS